MWLESQIDGMSDHESERSFEIPPEPLKGGGKDRGAMLSAVSAMAPDHPEIVVRKPQGRLHLFVGEWPIAMPIVEVVQAFLKEYPNGFGLRFSNPRRIDVPAPDVDEASDMAHDFLKGIRPLPGHGEGTDAA